MLRLVSDTAAVRGRAGSWSQCMREAKRGSPRTVRRLGRNGLLSPALSSSGGEGEDLQVRRFVGSKSERRFRGNLSPALCSGGGEGERRARALISVSEDFASCLAVTMQLDAPFPSPQPSPLGRGSTVWRFGLEEPFGVCDRRRVKEAKAGSPLRSAPHSIELN
jgi:hypothetical protein